MEKKHRPATKTWSDTKIYFTDAEVIEALLQYASSNGKTMPEGEKKLIYRSTGGSYHQQTETHLKVDHD